jgi:hypothetical protein
LGQPTCRVEADTQRPEEFGPLSTVEALIPENNDDRESGSETALRVCKPAMKLTETFFQ